jgi:hypothetical protein
MISSCCFPKLPLLLSSKRQSVYSDIMLLQGLICVVLLHPVLRWALSREGFPGLASAVLDVIAALIIQTITCSLDVFSFGPFLVPQSQEDLETFRTKLYVLWFEIVRNQAIPSLPNQNLAAPLLHAKWQFWVELVLAPFWILWLAALAFVIFLLRDVLFPNLGGS